MTVLYPLLVVTLILRVQQETLEKKLLSLFK